MKPADDPNWPRCLDHNEQHWCESTRGFFIDSGDAGGVEPGLRYCVPVVPGYGLFAEVAIDRESFASGTMAMMYLVKPGVAPDSEDLHSLGMWTQGEGRLVIAAAVVDWIQANAGPKCIANGHGFKEEMQYQNMMKSANPDIRKADAWCLAYYEQCYVCYGSTAAPRTIDPDKFTAAQFGLGGDNFTPVRGGSSGNTTSQSSRDQQTLGLLQNRFGS